MNFLKRSISKSWLIERTIDAASVATTVAASGAVGINPVTATFGAVGGVVLGDVVNNLT